MCISLGNVNKRSSNGIYRSVFSSYYYTTFIVFEVENKVMINNLTVGTCAKEVLTKCLRVGCSDNSVVYTHTHTRRGFLMTPPPHLNCASHKFKIIVRAPPRMHIFYYVLCSRLFFLQRRWDR